MKYIQLTRGKKTIVDDEDFEYLNQWRWYLDHLHGYACRTQYVLGSGRKNEKNNRIYLHRLLLNPKKNEEVDHINMKRLDNRRSNLRIATKSQQRMNQKTQKNTTSGYKGVSFYKSRNQWEAYINKNYKRIKLGYFKTAQDAARAYNEKAKEIFGEFARLNTL